MEGDKKQKRGKRSQNKGKVEKMRENKPKQAKSG